MLHLPPQSKSITGVSAAPAHPGGTRGVRCDPHSSPSSPLEKLFLVCPWLHLSAVSFHLLSKMGSPVMESGVNHPSEVPIEHEKQPLLLMTQRKLPWPGTAYLRTFVRETAWEPRWSWSWPSSRSCWAAPRCSAPRGSGNRRRPTTSLRQCRRANCPRTTTNNSWGGPLRNPRVDFPTSEVLQHLSAHECGAAFVTSKTLSSLTHFER